MTFTVALANELSTTQLMADLALLAGPGDVIALSGDLGAGKTAAARAFIRYLAGDDALEVPSPTFTLAQTYDLPPFQVLHADLYRIGDPSELEEIGLSSLPDGALVLIEWPERAGRTLPDDRLEIALKHDPAHGASERVAQVTGFGKAKALADRLENLRDFLDKAGVGDARRVRMAGDASTRSYARLIRDDGVKIIMNAPRRPDGPAVHDAKSYSAAVHLAEDVRPFVAMAEGLRAQGFSAPIIHASDLERGFLLTEDFGSASFVRGSPPAPIPERYEAATDMLAAMHGTALPLVLPLPSDASYAIPSFDIDAMLTEVSLLLDWYLPDRGVPPDERTRNGFMALWRNLLSRPGIADTSWILRDFHSPNLIWLEGRADVRKVGVIDFQDAVLGPTAYDLVSLLQDARIDVPESLELAMLSRYIKARRAANAGFAPAEFAERYAVMSAQRNTRLLGTFSRLNRRDGKPQYLRHQPRIWTYLNRSLAHPALSAFRAWYATRNAAARSLIRNFYRPLAAAALISPDFAEMQAMAAERRRGERVTFERGIRARMVAIDGTWQIDCVMEDISETGAKLAVQGATDKSDLKEFFLLLSASGLIYRRCEVAWSDGDQLGVNFTRHQDKKKGKARRTAQGVEA